MYRLFYILERERERDRDRDRETEAHRQTDRQRQRQNCKDPPAKINVFFLLYFVS